MSCWKRGKQTFFTVNDQFKARNLQPTLLISSSNFHYAFSSVWFLNFMSVIEARSFLQSPWQLREGISQFPLQKIRVGILLQVLTFHYFQIIDIYFSTVRLPCNMQWPRTFTGDKQVQSKCCRLANNILFSSL